MVAYEVALLLKHVDLVVSIDGTARSSSDLGHVDEREHRTQMGEILDGFNLTQISSDTNKQMIDNSWILLRMSLEHKPTDAVRENEPPRVLLLKVSGSGGDDYGWSDLPVNLSVESIPGNHFTMLASPNVDTLMRRILEVTLPTLAELLVRISGSGCVTAGNKQHFLLALNAAISIFFEPIGK